MPSFYASDGTQIAYRSLGQGPTVLLLHGFGLDGRQWLPQVMPRLHKYRFILPDMRGHGGSASGPYQRHQGLTRLTQDIEELLKNLQVNECSLGAYSMGAFVGLNFLQNPGSVRIRSYLHIEAGPCFHPNENWDHGFNRTTMEPACRLVEAWDRRLLQDPKGPLPSTALYQILHFLTKDAFPHPLHQKFFKTLPESVFRWLRLDLRFVHEIFAFLMHEGFDLRAAMDRISCPGLLLSGRHSTFFPWQAQEWMAQQWLQSEHRIYEKSGHGLIFSEPLRFQRDFQYFLKMGWQS